METTQPPKIGFYVKRSFGDKMNASFDFFKENWKAILKFSAYLLLPLCLIQALSLNTFMGSYLGLFMAGGIEDVDPASFGATFWVSYAVMMLCILIGALIVVSLIMALVKLYNEREDRLNGLTFGMLWPVVLRNMGRMFLMMLVMTVFMSLIMGVVVALVLVSPLTLLLTIPVMYALVIAAALCLPVYIYEKTGLFASIVKGVRLGFATWGGVFAVLFVMGLITGVLNGVVAMPWYIAVMLKTLFGLSSDMGAVDTSIFYTFFVYILGVLLAFGYYLTSIFSILGLSYQYAHATEKLDNVTVEEDIDNFEKL